MAHAKRASRRNGRRLGAAAGMSLAMGGGAVAAAPTTNVPSEDTAPRPVITLGEEEISDVSLATLYIFDKENESQLDQGIRVAAKGGGGCGGGKG